MMPTLGSLAAAGRNLYAQPLGEPAAADRSTILGQALSILPARGLALS
jgi:hypothetical protein